MTQRDEPGDEPHRGRYRTAFPKALPDAEKEFDWTIDCIRDTIDAIK